MKKALDIKSMETLFRWGKSFSLEINGLAQVSLRVSDVVLLYFGL